MTKVGQDFEMWAGDNCDVTVTVTDSTGASKDLTSGCVVWALAEAPASASLVRKTSDAASDIAISGCTFTVYLVPVETSALAGNYFHEAQVRDSAGKVSTVTVGNVVINGGVI